MKEEVTQILLIEDDDADALLFERMLRNNFRDPYDIIRAKTLGEGRSLAKDVSIIVSDLGLPDARGLETIFAISGDFSQVPLLILSGQSDPVFFFKAIELGAHDFLIKGLITGEALCRCIKSAIIRKRIENKLVQVSENRSLFFAQMTHEMRTPLNIFLGMIEELKETPLDSTQEHLIDLMYGVGGSLASIINDILDISKVEAGKIEIVNGKFNLRLFLQGLIDIFSIKAKQKGLDLSFWVDDSVSPYVLGDSDRIRQILFNLLGNAIKFTEKGAISVLVKNKSENELVFKIEDTGTGIRAEVLPMLFHPFQQGSADTYQKFGGTGLGLVICRRLLELMGGSIMAENAPDHQGSVFSFCIPLPPVIVPTDVKPIEPAEAIDKALLSHKRILVADDTKENLILYKYYFRGIGVNIDYAEDGKSAVELYKQRRHGIVILDNQMPEISGFDAAKIIRAYEQEHNLTSSFLLAVTGEDLDEREIKKYGFNAYLMKPIAKKALLETLIKGLRY